MMGQPAFASAYAEPEFRKLKLGISSCLLGEEVRFDGGHKRNAFLTDTFGTYVDWVSVCPELEMGLGVPRESLRLVGSLEDPDLLAPKSGSDHTEGMKTWAVNRLHELEGMALDGFVLKKDSPSCGLFRVRVYAAASGTPTRQGRGVFARELLKKVPLLPVEEEGRLNDPNIRETFIDRVFAYQAWKTFLREDATPGGLVVFHSAHKMSLLSHSPDHYSSLGRLVANAGTANWDELTGEYGSLLMEAYAVHASRGRHTNALEHLIGFIKNQMDSVDKIEVHGLVELHRRGLVPLVVPMTLLKHMLRKYEAPGWVFEQTYLNPYPMELMLRNHV